MRFKSKPYQYRCGASSNTAICDTETDSTLTEAQKAKRCKKNDDDGNCLHCPKRSVKSAPKMSRITVNLPEELVQEILSRVPATSVARFRSISKPWNGMIKDEIFVKKHAANAPRQVLFIMLIDFRVCRVSLDLCGLHDKIASAKITGQFSLKDDPLSDSSNEVKIRDVMHCKGLLLCSTVDDKLVVWNPFSGERKWIQPKNMYKETDCYAFGYDSKSGCYKILRMERVSDNDNESVCEIYDFPSNSWKALGVKSMRACRGGVYMKGSTYWIMKVNDWWVKDTFLLSFDFSEEKFEMQRLPRSQQIFCTHLALSVAGDDQLFVLKADWKFMDVLVTTRLEKSGVFKWERFFTAKTNNVFSPEVRLVVDEQHKAVVCCDNGKDPKNILHIAAESKYVQVNHHGAAESHCLLLSYVPTFTQIQQGI